MADERTIERTLRIAASPEVVFGFLTDRALLPRWLGFAAESDPRPGGIFRCSVQRRDIFVMGEFLEVEPPHRVVLSWGWEGTDKFVPPGSTRLEITLRRDGESTVLHLRHSGLPPVQDALHGAGWDHYLPRLAVACAAGDPGPDSWPELASLLERLAPE